MVAWVGDGLLEAEENVCELGPSTVTEELSNYSITFGVFTIEA